MDKTEKLLQILKNGSINSVFQPIVDFKNGNVFAYEGLSRVSVEKVDMNIENVFTIAKKENRLWELETLCRSKVLENARKKPLKAKLFINVDANIMKDPKMKTGFTYNKLREIGLEPEKIVFEITEKTAIESLTEFSLTIKHYRDQKYFIAVDDYGSGYSSLNRVCAFSPDFIKIDMHLVRDIDKDAIKKSAVSTTVRFCKESDIKVIAEGIETMDELKTLIKLGVDYGQGYLLARPSENFTEISDDLKLKIKEFYSEYNSCKAISIFSKIKQLASFGLVFSSDLSLKKALHLVENYAWGNDVFVVDKKGRAVGILTKDLLQYKFNNSSIEKKTVKNVMNKDFLMLDCNLSVEQAVNLTMQRSAYNLYCDVAVIKDGFYIGNISIKDLLLTISNYQLYNKKNKNKEDFYIK